MRTLLEMNDVYSKELVLCTGGLAGGIAGVDTECGGITAPLMALGLQSGNFSNITESQNLINNCQRYVNEFIKCNGSCNCKNISGRGITSCMNVICNFHRPLSKALSNQAKLPAGIMNPHALLIKYFHDNNFHCAHNVFDGVRNNITPTEELLRASWIFIGGSAFKQLTCGALTAGVIALSSQNVRIENSYSRVFRMIWLMMHDEKRAMRDEINHFNKSIRLSETLGSWFRKQFGSTSCNKLCGIDFSDKNCAERYISSDCIKRCRTIAERVAHKVGEMIIAENNGRNINSIKMSKKAVFGIYENQG
jgi:hypothetical protein